MSPGKKMVAVGGRRNKGSRKRKTYPTQALPRTTVRDPNKVLDLFELNSLD